MQSPGRNQQRPVGLGSGKNSLNRPFIMESNYKTHYLSRKSEILARNLEIRYHFFAAGMELAGVFREPRMDFRLLAIPIPLLVDKDFTVRLVYPFGHHLGVVILPSLV